MAWTSPLTVIATRAFTAADWNTYIRDNLLETMPAKATADARIFISAGANSIVERRINGSTLNPTPVEETTSATYTDLATAGPAVTLEHGARALVMVGAFFSNNTVGARSFMSHAISGSNVRAAADDGALMGESGANGEGHGATRFNMQTGLTSGTATFTAKYRVTAGSGRFAARLITVIPL